MTDKCSLVPAQRPLGLMEDSSFLLYKYTDIIITTTAMLTQRNHTMQNVLPTPNDSLIVVYIYA